MIEARVKNKKAETSDIVVLEIESVAGESLPRFEPGAHIDVYPRGHGGVVRQYSLCSAVYQEKSYTIGVLKAPDSRGGSEAMHALKEGDQILISAPRNHFPLAAGATHSILFAGGIGITPLLSMAEWLASISGSFELHYCTRTATSAAFGQTLARPELSGHVYMHYDDGADAQKLHLDAVLGAPQLGTHVYVCGPNGFMDWVLGSARAAGWADEQLHREYFASSQALIAPGTDTAFEIQVASTGEIINVGPDETVLEALATKGIELPCSCEQGVCGTCVTKVLEGIPDHRDSFFTEKEKSAGDQFTPCCSRSLSGRLVLDL